MSKRKKDAPRIEEVRAVQSALIEALKAIANSTPRDEPGQSSLYRSAWRAGQTARAALAKAGIFPDRITQGDES